MTDKEGLFIEEILLNSVKKLLMERVNELLGEMEYPIPPIEFGDYRNDSAVVGVCNPAISLSTCERSEKERIVRLDAYTLTITFAVPEHPSDLRSVDQRSVRPRSVRPRSVGERNCYAYASSVTTAVRENPTLNGVASRAVLTGKKYAPPKHPGTGEGWELVLTLRIILEGMTNAG